MKKLLILLMLLFPVLLHGQASNLSNYSNVLFGANGKPLAGAYVTVCSSGAVGIPCSPSVNIFNQDGTPLANPIRTDSLGNFSFWAASGIYTYTATGNGVVATGPFTVVLPCIAGQSCSTGSQFPWIHQAFSATATFNVGNGNVNYFMPITGNMTSVTFAGTPQNGNFLGIYLLQDNVGGHAINISMFPSNVQFAPNWSFPTAANTPYLMGWTYDGNQNIWIETPVWGGGGGGGGGSSFYQTVQQAGSSKPQQPTLNFLSPVIATNNPGNSSTDISIPLNYQTIMNNAIALPVEPRLNIVPPLLATDNAGSTRTDVSCPSYIGVGGSHSAGCMIDPGASGSGTDYPGRDAQWHTSGSAATVKPDPSTAIQFVAVTCNGGGACSDSNDGLSWGTAKQTVYTAACSFPGGNCGTQTAGSGTIFIGPGSTSNPIVGDGLWLMGSSDPNFASPPPGWLKCNSCAIFFNGVPDAVSNPNGHFPTAPLFGGSQTDRNKPALWLSGTFSNRFDNIAFVTAAVGNARPIVLGECSDHSRANCGVNGVAFNYDTGYTTQGGTFGPCMDVSSNSYWDFIDHFGCTGNSGGTNGFAANNAAAILIDGTGNNGSGLFFVDHCNFDDGGLKFIPGSSGGGFSIKNCTEESSGPSLPPVAWMTAFPTGSYAYAESLLITDNPNTITAFQNDDATGGSRGFPVVVNVGDVQGPVQGTASVTSTQPTASSLVTQHYGPSAATTPQRATPLVPVHFSNLAYSNPANWTISGGSVTNTPGVKDPFEGTGAATLASAGGGTVNLSPSTAIGSGAVGSWIYWGAWLQGGGWFPNVNGNLLQGCPGAGGFTGTVAYNNGVTHPDDGQWHWVWFLLKSNSASGNQCMSIQVHAGVPGSIYGAVYHYIPSGTKTDDDMLDLAWLMTSIDSSCAVGSICNVTGHPVSVDTLNLRFNTFTGSLVAGTLTGNRTYTFPDTSGLVPLFIGSITPGNNVCASGTVGLITTVGCIGGGGGGGTVNNASQFSVGYYSAAGNSNIINGSAAPITPDLVTQFLISKPSSGATQPVFALAGIPVRTFSGSPSDNVLSTDRNSQIFETFGGALALNASSTLFNNGFAFKVGARSTNSDVSITPSSGTCNGASVCHVLQGENATVTLDGTGNNLMADVHDPPLKCITGCTITRADYELDLSVTGAVSGSGTTGSLVKFTGPTAIGNADLTGDVTTAGTVAATVPRVNGITYPAGPSTIGFVPVLTGTSAVTYELVPAASMIGGGTTTENGQTCTVGLTCDINSGAANHSIAINKGASAAIAGVALTTNQIPAGVTGADPVAGDLSDLSATLYGGLGGGSTTAYTACSTPTATALTAGQVVSFKVDTAKNNTSNNPTLAWCGLTATTITSIAGNTLANGDLKAGQVALLMYDGTNFQLQNPQTNIIGGSILWNTIGNATGNLSLSNAAFTSTFNQTSPIAWTWANTTTATNAAVQSSPVFTMSGKYCTVVTVCTSATDSWTFSPVLASGSPNAASTFTFGHSGSTGAANMSFPGGLTITGTAGGATSAGSPGLFYDTTKKSTHIQSNDVDYVALGILPSATPASNEVATYSLSGSGAVGLMRVPTTISVGGVLTTANLTCTAATCLGSDTATTQAAGDNSTRVATTAYVDGHFIANGTSAMGTTSIASGACATTVTTSATGVATTDTIIYTPNSDPQAATGTVSYKASASGSLYVWAYPTANNVNFEVCNNTSSPSGTISAMTFNWKVVR